MRIAVARESRTGETRVALVPDQVARLTGLGYEVMVEPGAGERADHTDDDYVAEGAVIDAAAVRRADVVLAVHSLDLDGLAAMQPGATQISFLPTAQEQDLVVALRNNGLTSFAMELVPRISRAQPMDALTSQALVAGYRATVVAAGLLRKLLPLSLTAAGAVPPAEILVLGAGVAGLQAIATARRLGASVSGYDVRASSAEEIASLGATAIDLGLPALDGARGYAREMTESRARRQQQLLAPYVMAADAVITTAAVPGRQPPVLVTAAMVRAMRPGSVVVDIAADAGGNVEGVVPGEIVRIGRTQVWGGANVPAQMPGPASALYARNVVNLLALMTVPGHDDVPATFAPDFADEIVAGCAVTYEGTIVHEQTRELIEG